MEDGDGGVEYHVEDVALEDDGGFFVDVMWLEWASLARWW
jgi:hypothetical protein